MKAEDLPKTQGMRGHFGNMKTGVTVEYRSSV